MPTRCTLLQAALLVLIAAIPRGELAAQPAGSSPSPATQAGSLAAAEREFARAGLRDGIQKSFLDHFSDDAIVFRPFPTAAQGWYRNHPDGPGRLRWAPQFVAVSRAGDLGLSIGPWRYESEHDGKPASEHGHFMSLWRHDAETSAGKPGWRVVFDHGIDHPADPTSVEATNLETMMWRTGPWRIDAATLAQRRAALETVDKQLRQALETHSAADAYPGVARPDTLWLRSGSAPKRGALPGNQSARVGVGAGPRVALAIAASGDFAYTLGGSANQRAKGVDARVWTFRPGEGWKLFADLTDPVDAR